MEEKVDPIDIEDSISSIGSISQEFVVPVAPRSSYLPSWVLKFREKIELSREATDVLESRLDSLSLKTKELDDQILILRPKLKRASTGTADQQINSLVDSSNNGVDNNAPRYMMHLYFLPVDIIGELLQYLEVIDVCHLEIVSTAMKSTILDSEMWTIYHQAYFRIPTRKMTRIGVTKSTIDIKSLGPYPQLSLISNDVPLVSISYLSSHRYHMEARQHVIQHAKQCKDCVRFIRLMKDQRAVPKHRGIQPHRHSKAERHVTHPLPVFDRNQNTENALIMSHAETFNSDFRQIANRALDIMYSLTSRRFDPVNEALASEGAVSVLVSLLSNEAGAFQSYSCGILANLLCWEARKPWIRFHESQKHSIASDSDRHDNRYFHQHQTTHFLQARTKSIYQQVHACNGTRMLVSLLTSPTASINLAGGTPVVTGGFREGRMTSSVQGVSTKQACRALANLLDPLMSLPAPALHATGIYNTADLTIDASEASDDHINRPANLHTPFMASFILHEEEARQWRFTYYHKSGALKDRFNAYLKFSVDGYLRGRGVDLIGIFYVTGKVITFSTCMDVNHAASHVFVFFLLNLGGYRYHGICVVFPQDLRHADCH